MKPINTPYDGYWFRSRLEARWAVFFNFLGIKYQYEKEGYDLDGTYYLPDFWLPEQDCWVEIKAEYPTEQEIEKCRKLSLATDKICLIVFGEVWFNKYNILAISITGEEENGEEENGFSFHYDYFAFCRRCPGLCVVNLQCEWLNLNCKSECRFVDKCPFPIESRLIDAYTAARSARFEHGEKP